MARVGIALFGLGRMGKIHFNHLLTLPQVELLYIVDEFDETAAQICNKWHLDQVKILKPGSSDIIFKDSRVQAVIVCTPTVTHVPVLEKALHAGKHVFCEKPIAVTLEETAACYKMAEDNKVYLFCALNKRFDPAMIKIHDQIKSGKIGRLQLAISNSRDHPEPPMSTQKGLGGYYVDMAIHQVDLVSWIAGEYPVEIAAMGHAEKMEYKAIDDVETYGIMLKYPSGLLAYLDSCRYAPYGYDQRHEFIGTKGALVAENQRDDQVVLRDELGDHVTPIQYSFPQRFDQAYLNELIHFLNVMQGKEKEQIFGDEVMMVMRTVIAAETAAKTKKVVNL